MKVQGLVIVLLCGSVGCASGKSTYGSRRATGGELRWAYDGGLQATRGGELVVDTGWDGLTDAVACVPMAAELASSARSQAIAASIVSNLGLIGMLGGIGASVGVVAASDDIGDAAVPSLAILGGSLLFGLIFVGIGGSQRARSLANGLDAVNMYNDAYVEQAGCPAATPALEPFEPPPRSPPGPSRAQEPAHAPSVPAVETSTVPEPPRSPARTPLRTAQ